MSSNDLRQAVVSGDELTISIGGRDCLLYGWDQCDCYVLSLEREGELVWLAAPQSREACIDEFLRYYSEI